MEHPLVSVVIPCYNAEATVADAVRSALSQTYPHLEVVAVDDGSTDRTLAVLRSFGSAIRCVSGPNRGAARARNAGAREAKGQLLQFLDADDRLYATKLERQVPLAVANRPGMVFCDADVVDGVTGRSRGIWSTGAVSSTDPVIHALRVTIQTAGPLHWRETFDRVGGFRADTPPCDDRDLHLRIACSGVAFGRLAEALYVMRRFDGSLSKLGRGKGIEIQRRIGEDALRELGGVDALSPNRRLAFAAFFAGTGRVALRIDRPELAHECFQRARDLHPAGGLPDVYSKLGRVVANLCGPSVAERMATVAKTFRGHREIA